MVVKITQEQANYLETFGDFKDEMNKKHAIHHISRFGWGYSIEDGNGALSDAFDSTEQLMMVEAVVNGYKVIVPKFKFYKFSDKSESTPLYYAGKDEELTSNNLFAVEVEKNSKEYAALGNLGFISEEV